MTTGSGRSRLSCPAMSHHTLGGWMSSENSPLWIEVRPLPPGSAHCLSSWRQDLGHRGTIFASRAFSDFSQAGLLNRHKEAALSAWRPSQRSSAAPQHHSSQPAAPELAVHHHLWCAIRSRRDCDGRQFGAQRSGSSASTMRSRRSRRRARCESPHPSGMWPDSQFRVVLPGPGGYPTGIASRARYCWGWLG